ncbi:hypothetical protein HYC85_017379 [Camellia sinensis]|uniref:Uncharacterized protein n=1 Tax=Camellia sinensis TaxID=4442 RepID=A0A7J7H4L8_CAMSI|nr:hypothetical protein HYC85_017379 [Camellia sinensis]
MNHSPPFPELVPPKPPNTSCPPPTTSNHHLSSPNPPPPTTGSPENPLRPNPSAAVSASPL